MQVAIEYHVSAAGRFRVDVLLSGNDGKTDNGLIIELKAWADARAAGPEDMVWAPVGGGKITQHPSAQALGYKGLILNFNEDVRQAAISLHAAAYLFNLNRRKPEPLEDPKYKDLLKDSRLFLANDSQELKKYLETVVPLKPKRDVMFLIENGKMRPSDELIGRVSSMLDGNPEFFLINEQYEAFQIVRHEILTKKNLTKRHVFIIEGGPGTGKSVIAIRLLSEILKEKRAGFFVAPNAAFRKTLIEQLSRGNRGYREDGRQLLNSSWTFHDVDYRKDRQFEVLIIDEAHRLKGKGAFQYKGNSMVEDMVRAARVSVFFIDEGQTVSWNDIGSVAAIRKAAKKFNAEMQEPLGSAQFRCNGSTGYLNWLDQVLQVGGTGAAAGWDNEYDFRVFERAEDLYAALRAKNAANKARLIAGYSWDWPKQGRGRGAGTKHVAADELKLPWNFDGENWATSPDGIGQVGCIHTCQGLEFDWLGVLIGGDLSLKDGKVVGIPEMRAKTDSSLKGWKSDLLAAKGKSAAEKAILDRVQEIIKGTYKTLLTRGRKGCFVWCEDTDLSAYLQEHLTNAARHAVTPPLEINPAPEPFILPNIALTAQHVTHLPVFSLAVAAGEFTEEQKTNPLGWVEVPSGWRLNRDMFVTFVKGRSMLPRIPDGAWCIFRWERGGSRNGKIVLVESRLICDPENDGRYTVKKYSSEVGVTDEGAWKRVRITLSPINPEFEPIILENAGEDDFRVVAEFVDCLPIVIKITPQKK